MPNGDYFRTLFHRLTTVSDVRELIYSVIKLLVTNLVLLIGDKGLYDDDNLFQCKATDETTIQCIFGKLQHFNQ